MQHVFRVAILGSLVLIAAPTQAQQFSFMTGDRAMQGYAPRATNDGYQAGGGGNPGQAPDTSNSPYQSGLAASSGPGQQASAGQGTGGGGAGGSGGTGVALYAPGGGGGMAGALGTNAARQEGRTVDLTPTGGPSGGTPLPFGTIAPIEQKTAPRTIDSSGGGGGGNNSAISGNLPGGLGCPPMCGSVAGRASALTTANQASIIKLDNVATGGGTTAPYQFKFQAPQTEAFVKLAPVPTPGPPPVAAIQIPPAAHVTNLGPVNNFSGGVPKTANLGSVGGVNSGMGAGGLKNLQGVNSVNNLMLQRQKN